MSTNISKQKRDDLIEKIKAIRAYIASAQQDENTGSLLVYLSELEKEVKRKKYGLIFEQHRESIDELLDTHTPVLTEEKKLFIDNGGQMNFLIEGDNLAALELLLKTHKGKINVIYIDPPYNTGKKDFIYDDQYVDTEDGYRHSKWLSFMQKRLKIASRLVTKNGVIAISIGYQEVHHLVPLCEEIFQNRQVVCVTVQTSGGKPSGGFNYLQEYLLFIAPFDFNPNPLLFSGGINRSPYEGLTLSTFDKTQRPNQTYPIFIDKKTEGIVGVGPSLTSRIRDGIYNGELSEFKFDYNEAPEGTVALWPISSKGSECVWRLISTRLMDDWKKGYIKVSKNKSKNNPNKYSVQYLPDGVIKKKENGLLDVVGTEDGVPTLVFGENKTVGSDIPTIWTEKSFYTTKGTVLLKEIFNEKIFSYPKPVEFICEILRATCNSNSIVLDFFAGSGTTGHAIMELNESDNGSRKFILCTNNQNNICRDVTYERIKRVISGEGYTASLKYYKTEFVPISERMYYEYADKLLLHVRELVELENGINFTGNAKIAIVLTDEEMADFISNIDNFKKCRKLYIGHDVLLTGEQEQLLKDCKIKINVIPDYYYKELEVGR